jgi:hypothetical protein
MSQSEHVLTALVLYILFWNLFLKKFCFTQEDIKRWEKVLKDKFFK